MTREEAIDILREYGSLFPSDKIEAIDKAVEALKREDAMLKEIERVLLYGERSEE